MINVNDFSAATDSEQIEKALAACSIANGGDGVLLIPPRCSKNQPQRQTWMLDRAILLPENTTVILRNVKLKLSDACRDNFFRSANCGHSITQVQPIRNIHIKGEGLCILEGADHPRATGDGGKILSNPCPKKPEDLLRLADWISAEHRAAGVTSFDEEHDHSFGTDAGKPGEVPHGDWRGIGILFAMAEDFSVENLTLVCTHGWGISLEACHRGKIQGITFDSCMAKEIDGLLNNMENQDGIDLRCGCSDILVSDIFGGTGDDIVALTAIATPDAQPRESGSYESTQILHNDWSRRERDIHDVIIRNIIGYSKGHLCCHVRLLAAECNIWNVVIDNVVDDSPEGFDSRAVLLLGEADGAYGRNLPGSIANIAVSNILCNSESAVLVNASVVKSSFTNIVNKNPECPVFRVTRPGCFEDNQLTGIVTAGKDIILEKA